MARLGASDGDLHNGRGEHVAPSPDWNPARQARHWERLEEHHRTHRMVEPIYTDLAQKAQVKSERMTMRKANELLQQLLGAEQLAEGVASDTTTKEGADDADR